jgi:hypothetical protein
MISSANSNGLSGAKYTPNFLRKLEDIFAESDYVLRYEKGNFKSGYCILNDQKVVIVNKFYPLEGKINCLLDIVREINMDISKFSDKNKVLYFEISQTHIKL